VGKICVFGTGLVVRQLVLRGEHVTTGDGRRTVGIPQALFYYRYFRVWRAFFAELGLDVVTSGPTNRLILDWGVEEAVTDACVPIKIMHGHVAALVDRAVDFVFVPRIVSTNGRSVYCPKFLGLPDMVRGVIKGKTQMIAPRYDSRQGRTSLVEAAVEAGEAVGADRASSLRALAVAEATLAAEQAQSRSAVRQADAKHDLTLAIVGYPYVVHDPYLNLDLAAKLDEMGVAVVTADDLHAEQWLAYRGHLGKDLFWTYSEEAVLAGYYFLDRPSQVDGLIHITAFGCGPDSVADTLLALRAEECGGTPYLALMVDEHTGEAGIRTRLEAFTDMIRRRKRRAKDERAATGGAADAKDRTAATSASPKVYRPIRGPAPRRVTFPYMGTLPEVFAEVLAEMGNDVIMPPRPTRRTLTLGTSISPEFACLPLKILMGTYLEALAMGADTIVSSGGVGPCRAGLYTMVHAKLLQATGHSVEILTLEPPMMDLGGFIGHIRRLNRRRLPPWRLVSLVWRAWRKIQALDELERVSHWVRACELRRGDTSRAWEQVKTAIYGAKTRRAVEGARRAGRALLEAVPLREGYVPLRVGIVGEIYVLVEPSSNFELEEILGHMGVETVRAIYMSGWTKESNLFGRPDQRKAEDAEQAAMPYLGEMIGGHGQESVGNAIKFIEAGFDGIIQLAPFTCIPEIVAKSVLERAAHDKGFPLLSLSLDEQTGQAGLETRLEAFVELLQRKRSRRQPGTTSAAGGAASRLAPDGEPVTAAAKAAVAPNAMHAIATPCVRGEDDH